MSFTKPCFSLLLLLCIFSFRPETSLSQPLVEPSDDPSWTPRDSLATVAPAYRPRIAELRQLVALNPNDADLHVSLGIELEAMGDLAGAISEYDQALRLQASHALAFYYLSRARLAERELADAQRETGIVPDDRDALVWFHIERGRALMAADDVPGGALAFREALTFDPAHPAARLKLGEALFRMGDLDAAIQAYRAALRSKPDLAAGRIRLAVALMGKEDWAGAQSQLLEAIRLDQESPEAQFHLGRVRYTLGDLPGAIAAYRECLRMKPDFVEAQYQLGLSLKMANQESDAVHAFASAAQAGMPEAQYFLGSAYLHGFGLPPDQSEAIEWWFRAADQDSDLASEGLARLRREALFGGGVSRGEQRALLRAFAEYRDGMWKQFPELAPGVPGDTVGWQLLRRGRTQEAVPVLIREAKALSDRAQVLLEALYEEGVTGRLARFDGRILAYFEEASREGLPRPRLALARIYAVGLGVEADPEKVRALLSDQSELAGVELTRIKINGS